MEYLKRKIKTDREENQDPMSVSIINGVRLSLRFCEKDKPEKDIVINFTEKETDKIRELTALD